MAERRARALLYTPKSSLIGATDLLEAALHKLGVDLKERPPLFLKGKKEVITVIGLGNAAITALHIASTSVGTERRVCLIAPIIPERCFTRRPSLKNVPSFVEKWKESIRDGRFDLLVFDSRGRDYLGTAYFDLLQSGEIRNPTEEEIRGVLELDRVAKKVAAFAKSPSAR